MSRSALRSYFLSALIFASAAFSPHSQAWFSPFDEPEKAIIKSENVLRIRVIRSVALQKLGQEHGKSAQIRLITFHILNTYKVAPHSLLDFGSKVGMATHFTGVTGALHTQFSPQKEYVICFNGNGATPTIRMSTAIFEIREDKIWRPSIRGSAFKESYADFVAWLKPLILSNTPKDPPPR